MFSFSASPDQIPENSSKSFESFLNKVVEWGNIMSLSFDFTRLRLDKKIYIEDGPRRGDWEVMDVTERKLKLRCPISNREVEWNRFCYFMEEAHNSSWPHPDE